MDAKRFVVVRTMNAGVFMGVLVNGGISEGRVTLDECRRLWRWAGAASLSELALSGVRRPGECKFPLETNGHEIGGVIEIIPATPKAVQSVKEVAPWLG